MKELVFLKLGGSVITDKDHANTANIQTIDQICKKIYRAVCDNPEISLLLGHGSGSFGHFAAHKYHTRDGVATPQQWQGFSEVGCRARALNQIVIERLVLAGLSPVSFSACSGITACNRKITQWNTAPLFSALQNGCIPVVYGDVIFDTSLGGTILSTEELFDSLAQILHPARILLAGLEEGVWKDFPQRSQLFKEITPVSFADLIPQVQGSSSTDVTGGMKSKVSNMISIIQRQPQLEIQIFSASQPENIYKSLMGNKIGTIIRNPERSKP